MSKFHPSHWFMSVVLGGWLASCMPPDSTPPGGDPATAGTGGSNAGRPGGNGGSSTGGGSGSATGGSAGGTSTGGSSGSNPGGTTGGTSGTGGSNPGTATGGTSGTAGMTGSDAGTPSGGDTGGPAAAIMPGYATCIVCHGPDGAGTDKGPDILHPVVDFGTWMVRNGRAHPAYKDPMPKYTTDQITDAQLMAIFSWLAKAPKATTGAALYKDFCQSCHGVDAKGGPTMREIATKTAAVYLKDVRAGHHPGEFANRREFMPKWSATEITDAEIMLIFTHVKGL